MLLIWFHGLGFGYGKGAVKGGDESELEDGSSVA
jgi:hypothetical protein